MRIYTLKSGRKIAFSPFARAREGEVVFFSWEEWSYIRQRGFSHAVKDYLWEQKSKNPRYPVLPEKGLTEPAKVVEHCREILQIFKKKTG